MKVETSEAASTIRNNFADIMDPDLYNKVCEFQNCVNQRQDSKIKATHIQKLNKLTQEKNHSNKDYRNNNDVGKARKAANKTVINLSSRELTKDQESLLKKGLKFVPIVRLKNYDDYVTNIEKGLMKLAPCGKLDYLRHQIVDVLTKSKARSVKDNLTKGERRAIRELRDDKSIRIVPADKGKATVVIDKQKFNDMVETMLADNSTYRQIKKDPTKKLEREHRERIKQLRDKGEIDYALYQRLNVSNPRPPYAKATVKVHKDPVKIRLLVCSRDMLYYGTAQYITKLITPLASNSNSFVRDSTDFCEKIKAVQNPGKLISYDVVDLFTNVPLDLALDIIRDRISEHHQNMDTKLSEDSIMDLLLACTKATYFTWGDRIYEQIHGLPMGSPLSPIITELFMMEMEEKALVTAPCKPLCWLRKVDDIFTILRPEDDENLLLDHLNQQHARLQFTMEKEHNNSLPFLDVYITREADQLHTSVYRKPSHTDQYINWKSCHPRTTKEGIIATLTKRAKNVCSGSSLQSELDHLRNTFIDDNDYPAETVNCVINKTLLRCDSKIAPPPRSPSPIFITLPFIGKPSLIIRRMLRDLAAAEVVFVTNPPLKNYLKATGKQNPSVPAEPKGTVYKIDCSCKNSYIGETGRPLDVRVKEHRASTMKSDQRSAISEHLSNNPDHTIEWNNVQKLSVNNQDNEKRKILEAIYIKRLKPQLNRDNGLFIHNAYDYLI